MFRATVFIKNSLCLNLISTNVSVKVNEHERSANFLHTCKMENAFRG